MNLLYSGKSIINTLKSIFALLFPEVTKPTRALLCNLMTAYLAADGSSSVRKLYHQFLTHMSKSCLNSYYHALENSRVSNQMIQNGILRMACSLIPDSLKREPVFLAVDDTTITKAGKKFDNVGILYDHSAHDGNYFVNGHCFVSLVLSIPVFSGLRNIRYIPIPVGYTLWDGSKTKLEIAGLMIRNAASLLKDRQVILSFDSWYAKTPLIEQVLSLSNVSVICNARVDSAMYDLPPEKTGRRGRPAVRGKKLTFGDFDFNGSLGNYSVAHRQVKTKLFGNRTVDAYVTVSKTGSHRVFFSTVHPEDIHICTVLEESEDLRADTESVEYYPLKCYKQRWNIEKTYYVHKTFWFLGSYMVRRRSSIEHMMNLINAVYSVVQMLPYAQEYFSDFQDQSTQDLRHFLSIWILQELFLERLTHSSKLNKKQRKEAASLKNQLQRIFSAA